MKYLLKIKLYIVNYTLLFYQQRTFIITQKFMVKK